MSVSVVVLRRENKQRRSSFWRVFQLKTRHLTQTTLRNRSIKNDLLGFKMDVSHSTMDRYSWLIGHLDLHSLAKQDTEIRTARWSSSYDHKHSPQVLFPNQVLFCAYLWFTRLSKPFNNKKVSLSCLLALLLFLLRWWLSATYWLTCFFFGSFFFWNSEINKKNTYFFNNNKKTRAKTTFKFSFFFFSILFI